MATAKPEVNGKQHAPEDWAELTPNLAFSEENESENPLTLPKATLEKIAVLVEESFAEDEASKVVLQQQIVVLETGLDALAAQFEADETDDKIFEALEATIRQMEDYLEAVLFK